MAEYTSKGVPKIHSDTWESIRGRYIGRGNNGRTDWGKYVSEVQRRICDEEPAVREYMEMQASGMPRELQNQMFAALVGLYALIETQIDINQREEQ